MMVKFDREQVERILTVGEKVRVTITSRVEDIPFEGGDDIRVISPSK